MGVQEGEKYLYLERSGGWDNAYFILHVMRDNTNKTGLWILTYFVNVLFIDDLFYIF